jgi:hypothetical protein
MSGTEDFHADSTRGSAEADADPGITRMCEVIASQHPGTCLPAGFRDIRPNQTGMIQIGDSMTAPSADPPSQRSASEPPPARVMQPVDSDEEKEEEERRLGNEVGAQALIEKTKKNLEAQLQDLTQQLHGLHMRTHA